MSATNNISRGGFLGFGNYEIVRSSPAAKVFTREHSLLRQVQQFSQHTRQRIDKLKVGEFILISLEEELDYTYPAANRINKYVVAYKRNLGISTTLPSVYCLCTDRGAAISKMDILKRMGYVNVHALEKCVWNEHHDNSHSFSNSWCELDSALYRIENVFLRNSNQCLFGLWKKKSGEVPEFEYWRSIEERDDYILDLKESGFQDADVLVEQQIAYAGLLSPEGEIIQSFYNPGNFSKELYSFLQTEEIQSLLPQLQQGNDDDEDAYVYVLKKYESVLFGFDVACLFFKNGQGLQLTVFASEETALAYAERHHLQSL